MMQAIQNILSVSIGAHAVKSEMEVLQQHSQEIPSSVRYVINRYRKPAGYDLEDTGMLSYNYAASPDDPENNLQLVFCISGNKYCKVFDSECSFCKHSESHDCQELVPTVDIAFFRFEKQHLGQYIKDVRTTSFSEKILNFTHSSSFTRILPICGNVHGILTELMNHTYTESMENIFVNAQTQMLLLHAMECMAGGLSNGDQFTSKFLKNEEDREKIVLAREVLLQHIFEPLTIKELSRKAAINECYLKKGFKEMYGSTVFDFFQNQRMEHAKYLLYEKGHTVTDVSNLLGYSSISHFSTAFKRHTGLKPCELLR